MKTNKEIIIEELKKAIGDGKRENYLVLFSENFEQFATNLLSKLNILDRVNVEKINQPQLDEKEVRKIVRNVLLPPIGNVPMLYALEQINLIVDKICELAIPTQLADSIGKQIEAGVLAGDIEDLVLSQKEVVDNLEVMIYERDKKIKELEIENDKLKTELEK